jgi:protein subunit release factor A
MEKEKTLLFSLTKKDFVIQTFCTGGPGGQHKNAKQNGVRIIHPASGARAEHRDGRDQAKNKTAAFLKLMDTLTFKQWHKLEVQKRLGVAISECEARLRLEAKIDEMLQPENLKVEWL